MLLSLQAWAGNGDSLVWKRFSRFDDGLGLGKCDACGCSASGGGMGFGSVYSENFVGVRYFYQQYRSKDGIFDNSPHVRENFNTVQVWARVPIGKRVQVMALVPYQFHVREKTDGDEKISGLGDVTVLGLFNVWESRKDSVWASHKLQVGGGVKLPTGKYDAANNEGSVNPGFQVGTGSYDYIFAGEYLLHHKNLGLDLMASYTIKTENSQSYRFGNQLNYGGTFFYTAEFSRFKMVPHLGVAVEQSDYNLQHGLEVPDTSGYVLFSRFGVEAGVRKLSVGVQAMMPLAQDLSAGNVEAKYRLGVNVNYSL